MCEIVVLGTGGMGREVHQLVEDIGGVDDRWRFQGFLDDAPGSQGTTVHGFPVLGGVEWLRERPQVAVAIGVGPPAVRRRLVRQIEGFGPRPWPSLIHPSVSMGGRVVVGPGTFLCAGTTLTTDISLGAHVIVNIGCTLTHDSVVGDFATLAPGVRISGNVQVGPGADLGTGAMIIQGRSIGAWSILGAGAVVIGDVAPNSTVVGVPARVIKERPDGWFE